MLLPAFYRQLIFQSTLPRRERPRPDTDNLQKLLFQSTLPRRERPFPSFPDAGGDAGFQSTLPRRERPPRLVLSGRNTKHFNPRSRVGSDIVFEAKHSDGKISIHAPA